MCVYNFYIQLKSMLVLEYRISYMALVHKIQVLGKIKYLIYIGWAGFSTKINIHTLALIFL